MISDIRYWEKKASEGHYAIPHFNVWNAEMLMGVIDAAEETARAIIIHFRNKDLTESTSFEDYCYMMESMAKKSKCSGNSSLGSRPQYDDPSKCRRPLHEFCNA